MATALKSKSTRSGEGSPPAPSSGAADLTINEIAAQALKQTGDDREAAIAVACDRIAASPDLVKRFLEPALRALVNSALSDVIAASRLTAVATLTRRAPPSMADSLRQYGHNQRERLMDSWRIYGGKPLGNATPKEIRASAEQNRKVSTTYGAKASFELAVADAAEANGPSEAPVRSTLTEATIARIHEEQGAPDGE